MGGPKRQRKRKRKRSARRETPRGPALSRRPTRGAIYGACLMGGIPSRGRSSASSCAAASSAPSPSSAATPPGPWRTATSRSCHTAAVAASPPTRSWLTSAGMSCAVAGGSLYLGDAGGDRRGSQWGHVDDASASSVAGTSRGLQETFSAFTPTPSRSPCMHHFPSFSPAGALGGRRAGPPQLRDLAVEGLQDGGEILGRGRPLGRRNWSLAGP